MTTMTKLTGHDAIEYAQANGVTLSKHTDPTEDARTGLTVAEAREIAAEDPSLIYVEVPVSTTTHHAAIDSTGGAGAVYGVGTTEAAALADAKRGGASGDYRIVPCTEAAAAYVERHGGAPSPELTVTSTGVCLRSEE